ncbi:hypothetical protein [Brachyspira sp. G79]|uniref:hypothetical protein n=1 Tax=Brachyspira sp. G79 TaxID=1358104 RepID=UPI000BBC251A|nr:hypothetical protein [Brachyspira sp. G79]PCG19718.1 hypothetical protein KQ44_06500 [Brachyspira sp. G79]
MDIELIIGILVFIVFLGPLVLYLNIGKILPSLKKWYSKNKIWLNEKELFMLKDKINNIYINCYKIKYDEHYYSYGASCRKLRDVSPSLDFDLWAHEYFDSFSGQIFINNSDELIIRETSPLYIDQIMVYHDYDVKYFKEIYFKQNHSAIRKRDKFESKEGIRDKLTRITFRKELDYEKASKIEYTMDIENKRIEGVFEVIRKPEIEIKQFFLPIEQIDSYDTAWSDMNNMMTNYLFNFNFPFIKGKERINKAISGAYNYDEKFKQEKGKELEEKLNHKDELLEDKFCLDDKTCIAYYNKLSNFRCLDILYYDDEVICVYKRTVEVEAPKEIILKNHSLIFELESERSISSYLRDLVVDSKELLSNYELTDNFYNNIDNVIFLLTDTGIIVMPEYPDLAIKDYKDEYEEIAERIFIPTDHLKNYLNERHYLFNFFNRR